MISPSSSSCRVYHYNDVTWASWSLKSQHHCLSNSLFRRTTKRTSKLRHHWLLVREIHHFPHKDQLCGKPFQVLTPHVNGLNDRSKGSIIDSLHKAKQSGPVITRSPVRRYYIQHDNGKVTTPHSSVSQLKKTPIAHRELRDVYWKYFGEKWPCYNGIYVPLEFRQLGISSASPYGRNWVIFFSIFKKTS